VRYWTRLRRGVVASPYFPGVKKCKSALLTFRYPGNTKYWFVDEKLADARSYLVRYPEVGGLHEDVLFVQVTINRGWVLRTKYQIGQILRLFCMSYFKQAFPCIGGHVRSPCDALFALIFHVPLYLNALLDSSSRHALSKRRENLPCD